MARAILGALIAIFGVSSAQAKMCDGVFPKNSLWIAADARTSTGISQATFNSVLDKVVSVYAPIVQAHGGVLQFNRLWNDGTVNSDTDLEGNTWVVNSYGGLGRYKGMTADGYAAIACHEIGHHLGGFPLFTGDTWASVEGEADYFATLKCFRTVFASDDNVKIVAGMQIDSTVAQKCQTNYPNNAAEIAICERAGMAGRILGSINASLSNEAQPAFNTPDSSQVNQTFEDHPASQCRLDTYFQAALCSVPANVDLGKTDYRVGACFGNSDGARPRCWFDPPN